jgi:hypothetical protein
LKHETIAREKFSQPAGTTGGFGGRDTQRAELTLICEVRQASRPWQIATLDDISQNGFHIAWLPRASLVLPLRIRIPGLAVLLAHIRWQHGNAVGCEFSESLHIAVFEHIVRQASGVIADR